MAGKKVLLADGDESSRGAAVALATREGLEVLEASNGQGALRLFQAAVPDLVVLETGLREPDGFDVCAVIRRESAEVPILFASSRGDLAAKELAFGAGADDYLVKPYAPQELLWRMRALLRRTQGCSRARLPECIAYGDLQVDMRRRRVLIRGQSVNLTPKEFHVLSLLASNPGEVFGRDQLVRDIWGPEFVGESTSLAVIIRRIREKIEEDPSSPCYLQTVWHAGYRLGD